MHVCTANNHARIQETKAITGRGQRHEQGKALLPTISYYLQALTQFLLIRLGATTFIQKKRKRPPSKDESARQGP